MSHDHDFVDQVKSNLDIVDLIEHYGITLTHRGNGEYTGTVGARGNSGASLKVNRATQVFIDKKNGPGGDVLDWIGYMQKLDARGSDFPEVLRIAAEIAGLDLPDMTEDEKGLLKEKTAIHDLYTEAAEIYHENLQPEHYDYIREKWGITPETIDNLKIGYATTNRDLKELDDVTLKKSGLVYVNNGLMGSEVFRGRIIFPYWKNGKVVYLIGRETEETPESEREKGMKYKKLLVHKEKYEYVNPSVQNSYFYGEDSLRGQDYCVITEGVADCIVMLQAGFPCISPVTVQFREKDHPKLIGLTKRLDRVYICNDNETNEAGLKGAISTAEALETAGTEAKLVILPKPDGVDKIDVADYMKKHNTENFNKLMGTSVGLWDFKLSKQIVPVKSLDRLRAFEKFISNDLHTMRPGDWDLFVMNDVREHFDLKKGEIKSVVAENRPVPQKNTDGVEDRELNIPPDYRRFYEMKINRDGEAVIKLIFSEIADYLNENNNVLSYAEILYIYRDGIYQLGAVELKAQAQEIIKAIDFKGSITEATREIIHYLTYENPVREYPFNDYGNIVPVANGLLKLDFDNETVELMPFTPEYKFNFKLPVEYDQAANPEPIDTVLRQYVDNEEIESDDGRGTSVRIGYSDVDILYQIPAQAILQMTGAATFKKAYLLQGDAHAGKSSYLVLLNLLFGEENISKVSLQTLGTDRFSLAELEGKLLNCYDDLTDIPLSEGGVFKTVTGRYDHRIVKKGQQGYNATIKAVHVYTCNTPPTFGDVIANDTAFWERWEFINFLNLFELDPYFYGRTFTPENMSGFLNMIIDMAMKIKQNGRLLIDSEAGEVREKWQSNADPMYKFIEDQLVRESEKTIELDKTELFQAYTKYSRDHNVDPGKIPNSVTMFTKLVFKYEIVTKRLKLDDGSQPWVYSLPYSWRRESSPYYVKPVAKKIEQANIT